MFRCGVRTSAPDAHRQIAPVRAVGGVSTFVTEHHDAARKSSGVVLGPHCVPPKHAVFPGAQIGEQSAPKGGLVVLGT